MDEVKVGNKMVKARQYPWGTVQGKLSNLKFHPLEVVSRYRDPQFKCAKITLSFNLRPTKHMRPSNFHV